MIQRAYLWGAEGAAMTQQRRAAYIKPIDNGKRRLYAHEHLGRYELQVGGRDRTIELFKDLESPEKLVAVDVPIEIGDTVLLLERAQFHAELDSSPRRVLRQGDTFILPGQEAPENFDAGRWRGPDNVPDWTSRHTLRIDSIETVRLDWLDESFAQLCGYRADEHSAALGKLHIEWFSRHAQNDNHQTRNPWLWRIEGELVACP